MTPETAAILPPRNGPMFRQASPERRSGLMGVAPPIVRSAATPRMARAVDRAAGRWVDRAEDCEVSREDIRNRARFVGQLTSRPRVPRYPTIFAGFETPGRSSM